MDIMSYLKAIADLESQKRGIDPRLTKAIISTESNWNPFAESRTGAKGLMQISKIAAKEMGTEYDTPTQNIQTGIDYFKKMMNQFKDLDHALAAYNIGPTRLRKDLKRGEISKAGKRYIKKVRANLDLLTDPFLTME